MLISSRRRRAASLVEVMVVVAIIAVLVALLLPAVVKVRESALRVQSKNNLRQLALATHQYAEANGDSLPRLGPPMTESVELPIFFSLLPYVEQGNIFQAYEEHTSGSAPGTIVITGDFVVDSFLSPADPSLPKVPKGLCSYGANACIFRDGSRLGVSFADGASNTIAFAEHYASNCGGVSFDWSIGWAIGATVNGVSRSSQRPTFADRDLVGVYPVTEGNPPMSRSSTPGLTFQVRPSLRDCDPRIPQTPHAALPVAMVDASVRELAPGISEIAFWGAVTPAGEEVLPADW